MKWVNKVRREWRNLRWKMLVIFAFFSFLSTMVIGALSTAVINVVIRRESAYLIEERLAVMADNQRFSSTLANMKADCTEHFSSAPVVRVVRDVAWTGIDTTVSIRRTGGESTPQSRWPDAFSGIIRDGELLSIRNLRVVGTGRCRTEVLADTPLDVNTIARVSRVAGLQVTDYQMTKLGRYRYEEGVWGQIASNFIPRSRREIPVVITATNWLSGEDEDWVVCRVRLSYRRTAQDLCRMGLQPSAWLGPLGGLALALLLIYACGIGLSFRLSRRIVGTIDALSHAALLVGKGDFTVRVPSARKDQLGDLALSFNAMTRDLGVLREREKQSALISFDLMLAREIQEHLYPQSASLAAGVTIFGQNIPARRVSGDLYQFRALDEHRVLILCADVSGKGASAALMMAHLQALILGQLSKPNDTRPASSPKDIVVMVNREICERFGPSQYATMFYGEYNTATGTLTFVNAGHCPPVLISANRRVTTSLQGDMPVGLFADTSFHEWRMQLQPYSRLVLYTDGVTDAENDEGEAFGEERLLQLLRSVDRDSTARETALSITEAVTSWSAEAEQVDDITVLVMGLQETQASA